MRTPERQQRINEVMQAALAREPHQRAAFLDQACAGDPALRAAVEALLAGDEPTVDFLDVPHIGEAKTVIRWQGKLVGGRYLIEKELGRGGMGEVFLARDQKLHQTQVVIKLLQETYQKPEQKEWLEKKFKQEIEALARINHPGVVRALDVGELPDGRAYLVMQYVPGVSLRSMIRQQGMELAQAGELLRQIGHALAAAHAGGIFHRDLKPENIMLQKVGEEEYVKLIDFGIATVLDSAEKAGIKTTMVAGTLHYMAPEQLQGKPTAASDIYALGVIAYEMLTGRRPFKADSHVQLFDQQRAGIRYEPCALRPELPAAAQAVILKALSFDQRERYSSAKDFGDSLARALTVEVKDGPPPELELAHVLFTDLVGYSKLTIDEQTRLLQQLQEAVSATASFQQAQASERLIRLPTGDGMVLVFFDDLLAPVRCAVEIARAFKVQPELKLRMGIHTGPVQRVADINQNANIAGGGINLAQRVMDCGDAGHILLSQTVADVLRQHSEWVGQLQDWGEQRVKHGVKLHLFNLYTGEAGNPALPAKLRAVKPAKLWLTLALLLALTGIGTFIWWRSAHETTPQAATTPNAAAAERSLNYSLLVQKDPRRYPGSEPFLLPGEIIFEAGYQARLKVSSPQSGYLYVINEGPAQTSGLPDFNVLFPVATVNGGSAEINANQPIQLPPPSGKPERDWFVFDKEEGVEKIWLIWSARIVPEMEAVKSRANPRERGVINDPSQIKAVAQYLATQATTKPETEKDEVNKQTKLKGTGTVLVSVVKLEHH